MEMEELTRIADPICDFFAVPAFAFFAGFAFDPIAGRQMTAYSIWIAARGIKLVVRVGAGSSTRAGKRKQNTARRSAGWTCVKRAATLLGRTSIGEDGLMAIVCGTVPDIVTGSISGIGEL